MAEPRNLTIHAARQQMGDGDLTARRLVESCLERIHEREELLRAWATIQADQALAAAAACDRERGRGAEVGPLHGIPLGIKDIIDVKGMWTRAGCSVYPARIAERDAPVIRRLREAGAIILGKTTTTPFANNDPTLTRNPWNPEHTPGGSSSGSGAAVADRMCLAALGSQTGGSLIRPASYNGIVGFKPTYGWVSLEGVIPVSWSLDNIGPHARSMADAALVCRVIRKDRPNPFQQMPLAAGTDQGYSPGRPPKLGVLPEFLATAVASDVGRHLAAVRQRFAEAGAEIETLALPDSFARMADAHRTIFDTELACYHRSLFQTLRDQYPPGIRKRIEAGLKIPGHRYVEALRLRRVFQTEMTTILARVDAVFLPASLSTAPAGLTSTGSAAANLPWSFCGFPAISLPSGLDRQGLPFGVQLVGLPWFDDDLAAVAAWCETVLGFAHAPQLEVQAVPAGG